MPDFLLRLAVEAQTWIRGAITNYLDVFASTHDWGALAAVLPLGVLFGFVHALTPGHGKTVLSTYVLGSGLSPTRATLVAVSLSLTHVASAVLLAVAAVPLITRTIGGAGSAPVLEKVSRTLIILIGLWLVLRAVRGARHMHGEGVMVGVIAGLVPCPLTFLTMFMAMARGIPEAGLTFAAAMMLGITGLLALVSVATVLARDAVTLLLSRHGASLNRLSRIIEGVAGLSLVVIGTRQLVQ
jgi:nickel/cobalt exporter